MKGPINCDRLLDKSEQLINYTILSKLEPTDRQLIHVQPKPTQYERPTLSFICIGRDPKNHKKLRFNQRLFRRNEL